MFGSEWHSVLASCIQRVNNSTRTRHQEEQQTILMSAGMRDGPAIILCSWRTVVKASRSFRDDHTTLLSCTLVVQKRFREDATVPARGSLMVRRPDALS